MAEAEIADISLTPSEWNYVKLRSGAPRMVAHLSRRDGLLAVAALGCLYLLNGPLASHVCTLLTSVPAAIFTYKVLSSQPETGNPGNYRSILFYWVLQGGFGLLDVAFHESYGYFLAKFVLMSLAFGHAASQNKHVFTRVVTNPGPLQEDLTQCLTSVISLYDTDGFAIQSPFAPPSSTFMDDASTADEIEPDEEENDDMMTTQSTTTSCPRHRSDSTRHGINGALTPHPDLMSPSGESQATVALGFGDLITNPMEQLVFSNPHESKLLTVANVSQQNVMWALKCNALHRLSASPACGVISRGAKQQIKLSYLAEEGDGERDKLAIDYALVDLPHYDPAFVNRADKKRHLLRISYAPH